MAFRIKPCFPKLRLNSNLELTCAPDCAPWSVASNTKDPQVRQEERLRDQPGLNFTQNSCEKQSKHGRGFVVEQPYGSAMWTDGLQLENIQATARSNMLTSACTVRWTRPTTQSRKLQVLVPTSSSTRQPSVGGHNGCPHAHLCGQVGGVNPTAAAAAAAAAGAAAAVYPHDRCANACAST